MMVNPDSLVRLLNLERDLTAPPEQREEVPDAETSTDQHNLVAGHPGSPRGRVGSRGQMAVANPESLRALLRADLSVAWADDRLPVVVLAVMVAAVVLLAGGLGWWLLSGAAGS